MIQIIRILLKFPKALLLCPCNGRQWIVVHGEDDVCLGRVECPRCRGTGRRFRL